MKTWRDYDEGERGPDSLHEFLKFYTDGPKNGPGSRYECAICGSEFSDHFAVRTCWQYYHGEGNFSDDGYDPDEHCIKIRFDEDGEQIDE